MFGWFEQGLTSWPSCWVTGVSSIWGKSTLLYSPLKYLIKPTVHCIRNEALLSHFSVQVGGRTSSSLRPSCLQLCAFLNQAEPRSSSVVLDVNWAFFFLLSEAGQVATNLVLFSQTHISVASPRSQAPRICVGPRDHSLTNECRDRPMCHFKAKAAASSYTVSDSLFPSHGNLGDCDAAFQSGRSVGSCVRAGGVLPREVPNQNLSTSDLAGIKKTQLAIQPCIVGFAY